MTRKRSKIRSKTRSDSSQKSEDEILYCICRSSDGTRFMIACDHCEEWYHGDCINVTPKQANNIKRFFCHLCIGRNPSLEIEYKTIKENRPRLPNLRQQIKKINFSSEDENDADLSSSSTPEKSFVVNKPKRTIRKRSRPSLSESVKSATIKKRRGRPKEKPEDFDDEATEDEIETSGFGPGLNEPIGVEETGDSVFGKKSFGRSQLMNNNTPTGNSISNNIGNNLSRNNNNSNTNSNNNYLHSSSVDTGGGGGGGGGGHKSCGNCDGCKTINNCGKCDVCCSNNNSKKSRFICRKRLCIRDLKSPHQFHKDYNTPLLDEDYDGVLGETGFSRHDNNRSRNEYDINEIRQRLSSNPTNPNKELTAVGSKMRRGDHLPGGGNSASLRRGLNTTTYFGGESVEVTNGTPFRYRQQPSNRLSRNQNTPQNQRRPRPQSDTAQMSSNTSSVSGQMSPRQYHQYAEESDEDVMIPSELMSPTNGQRRTLAELDSRNYASYSSQQQQQRVGKSTVNSDTRKYHYGLSYPDHLYCKHHRFYNWHSSISGDSISPDITNCKAEPNLKLSDKEGEILSHSHLRSPSLEQQLSPGNFMVIDRTVKQAQISSTGMRHKSQLKTNNSIANDRHDVSETFVTMYTEPNQVYPIIDLNQQIASGIPLNSSAQLTLESSNPHSTSVFTKLSMANVHRQEFYTINDEDDLEINWPKETVNV